MLLDYEPRRMAKAAAPKTMALSLDVGLFGHCPHQTTINHLATLWINKVIPTILDPHHQLTNKFIQVYPRSDVDTNKFIPDLIKLWWETKPELGKKKFPGLGLHLPRHLSLKLVVT